MPCLFNMLVNFAHDLHEDGQMNISIAVGFRNEDLRPWELDELRKIAHDLYPDEPLLTCSAKAQRSRRAPDSL